MRRFWVAMGLLVSSMLLLFFLVQALNLPFLQEDANYWLLQEKWVAALAGVGLLVADVVAPVPSSIIMWVNGVLFGVFGGTLLSLLGGMGATYVGYWIGLRGEAAARRWMGETALQRAGAFFEKYGMLALVASRPIPILAEAVSIVAGLSGMKRGQLFLGAGLGLLPTALLYALAGAYAMDFNTGLYTFLAVFALSSIVFLIGRAKMKSKAVAASGRS
jgi:uncharacterized membrane protein YdjX (TVP38/TMEM64 family)